jgi:APA family basic amino acid/polyamine antiporter
MSWFVNEIGVAASVSFQIITVVQLISGILLVIISALIGGGHPDFSQPLPQGISGFLQASVIAMLTYTGWNIIGEMGDEIENPRRNIPLTVILGLGIVTMLYVGIGWVVSGTLSPEEMKASKVAVLDTALYYLPRWTTHYINLAAFSAAITSVNAVFLAVPRELFALSENGILPKWFMKYNPQRQNFPISIAVVAIAGALLSLLNLNPDIWGMFCVAGLLGANALISMGTLRLFALFPDKVANAPLKLKKSWVYPSSILSALFSFAFALMAFYFYKPIVLVFAIVVLITGLLAFRSQKIIEP